jgi:gamma-glutamylcyclotransferase
VTGTSAGGSSASGISAAGTWYFAYGSNLSVYQKTVRTGTIREARRCRLHGYRLAFNKWSDSRGLCANIVPDEAATVWGVAYLCDEAAIAELDDCEGVAGGHYRHEHVAVVTDAGDVLEALTYVAGEDHVGEEGRPSRTYLDRILAGARQHGLPEEYVRQILELGSRASE